MAKMIGARDEVVRTKVGHVVAFVKGEEVFVPEDKAVIDQCLKAGHKMAKEAAPARKPEPVAETSPPVKKAPARPAAVKSEAVKSEAKL